MQQLQLFDLDAMYPPHPMIPQMEMIYEQCKRLRDKLHELGYTFQYPDCVISGPAENVDSKLFPLKTEFGTFPEALRQFYMIIGSMNFSGHHPEWTGCDYPDALRVEGIDSVLDDFKYWIEDKPLLKQEYVEPFGFRINHDYYIEVNVRSGTHKFCFATESWDPIIEDHCGGKWRFVQYLKRSLKWGGFPGLARSENHTWPLEELQKVVDI